MYTIVLRYKPPLSEIDKHIAAHREWLRKNYADGTFLVIACIPVALHFFEQRFRSQN
jgi:hypothetical protein